MKKRNINLRRSLRDPLIVLALLVALDLASKVVAYLTLPMDQRVYYYYYAGLLLLGVAVVAALRDRFKSRRTVLQSSG